MIHLTAAEIAGFRETVDAVQLLMTCDIARREEDGTDAYNHPVYDFEPLLTAAPCYFWEEHEEEALRNPNITVTRERLLLPANTDITNRDRVTSITGPDGTQIAGPLQVIEVLAQIPGTLVELRAIT